MNDYALFIAHNCTIKHNIVHILERDYRVSFTITHFEVVKHDTVRFSAASITDYGGWSQLKVAGKAVVKSTVSSNGTVQPLIDLEYQEVS